MNFFSKKSVPNYIHYSIVIFYAFKENKNFSCKIERNTTLHFHYHPYPLFAARYFDIKSIYMLPPA